MVTWSNLLNGYPAYERVMATRSTMVSDVFDADILTSFYTQILGNLSYVFTWVFTAIPSGLLVVIFFSLLALLVIPIFRITNRW